MGIFDKIKHAIFGDAHAATVPASVPDTGSVAAAPTVDSTVSPAPSASTSPIATVDIEPILDAAVKKSGQKLDWRHSIVDLMKAVGMDASLDERKELAAELNYTGDTHDSAKMNMWLHKALIQKLAENGGKVPADLID